MQYVDGDDVEWTDYDTEAATFRRKELSAAGDADMLGTSLYELPAGERSWPYHYHTANAEAMYVLAGEGQVRGPDGEVTVSAGDYCYFPADESGGHRVVNDSDGTLRYLMVSTMVEPDVTIYPEKETFGVYVGAPPGGRGGRDFEGYYDIDSTVDYWE
jgi:uncharacterized cupin superfamily protein